MLDIKAIREDKDRIIHYLNNRGKDHTAKIERILELDNYRRMLRSLADQKKAERREGNKDLPVLRDRGDNVDALMARLKRAAEDIKEYEAKAVQTERELRKLLLSIPNTLHHSVITGRDDEDNIEVHAYKNPEKFKFPTKSHWEIGKELDILDSERAAKVTGARFHFYKGLGAKLERALINFYLDRHTAKGYVEVIPPFMVNSSSMIGTGQLPKFSEDVFKVEDTDYYLIPTAEVPVTNLYRNEILDENCLPIKHCAYSPCFRAEAGSAGRDTKGLIRQHQFNKVELVKFTTPETSYQELETLIRDAEVLLEELDLPYRTIVLCGWDTGFSSAKTYDIEVWMPSYERYAEISSCSNFEDYQARRASLKYRDKKTKRPRYMHTLNGSGLAIGRTVAAILENYQNEDGSVTVPKALIPYMGCEVIK